MTRSSITASLLLASALLFPETGQSQKNEIPADSPLTVADLAWERGDYRTALSGYLRLLDSPDAATVLEPIALRTGELYETTELTRDGALPKFSPGGKYIAYETGPIAARVIRVVSSAEPTRTIVELRGSGASFGPDGSKLAYWKTSAATPTTASPAAPATPAPATTPPAAAAPAGRLALYDIAAAQETALDTGDLTQSALFVGAGEIVLFSSTPAGSTASQIHTLAPGRPIAPVTADPSDKIIAAVNSTGTALLFTTRAPGTGRGGRGAPPAGGAPGGGRGAGAAAPATFGVMSIL